MTHIVPRDEVELPVDLQPRPPVANALEVAAAVCQLVGTLVGPVLGADFLRPFKPEPAYPHTATGLLVEAIPDDDEVVALLTPWGRLTVAPHARLLPGALTPRLRHLGAERVRSVEHGRELFRIANVDGIRLPAPTEIRGVGDTTYLVHLVVEPVRYPVYVGRVGEWVELIAQLYPR